MKKLRMTLLLSLVTCSVIAQDSRWFGDNNLTSTISRNGSIGVNGLYFGRYGSSLAGDINPYTISSYDNEVHDLVLYGSSASTLHFRLLDGDLKIGPDQNPNLALYNSGGAFFNGNVGIGVPIATQKFDLVGRLKFRSNNSNTSGFWLTGNNGSEELFVGQQGVNSTDPFGIWHGGDWRFLVTNNGNVGIGTNDPMARLEVHEPTPLGQSIGDHQLLFRVSGRGHNTIMHNQWLLRDAPGSQWWYTRLHDGISVDASFLTPGTNTLTWWERDPNGNIQSWGNADQTYLTINQGYVGIGTTNPDAKLSVKGTVHAEEVKVDLQVPGPDYVFEPTYQLPSLTEIENYIKANKHLPEVPSAKEMETNGINLSEMNMLLLKKVEELTLYIIKQEKRISDLESKQK